MSDTKPRTRLPRTIHVATHAGDHDDCAIWNLIRLAHTILTTELDECAMVVCSCGYTKAVDPARCDGSSPAIECARRHLKSMQASMRDRKAYFLARRPAPPTPAPVGGVTVMHAGTGRFSSSKPNVSAKPRPARWEPSVGHDALCERAANQAELDRLGEPADAEGAEAGFAYAQGLGLIDARGEVACGCAKRTHEAHHV